MPRGGDLNILGGIAAWAESPSPCRTWELGVFKLNLRTRVRKLALLESVYFSSISKNHCKFSNVKHPIFKIFPLQMGAECFAQGVFRMKLRVQVGLGCHLRPGFLIKARRVVGVSPLMSF